MLATTSSPDMVVPPMALPLPLAPLDPLPTEAVVPLASLPLLPLLDRVPLEAAEEPLPLFAAVGGTVAAGTAAGAAESVGAGAGLDAACVDDAEGVASDDEAGACENGTTPL